MTHLDAKISFIAGYFFTAATTISAMGLLQAALVGLIGGFCGLLGKEIYYSIKDKVRSARFKVWLIGKLDKLAAKIGVLKRWW